MVSTLGFLSGLLGTLFGLVAAFMILVVLIQKPKGGGLSGAFGGGGSGGAGADPQAMFGAKVGDVLTIITVCCFVAFLLLAISLVYLGQASVTPDYEAEAQATTGQTTPETADRDTTGTEETPPDRTPASTGASDIDGAGADETGTDAAGAHRADAAETDGGGAGEEPAPDAP